MKIFNALVFLFVLFPLPAYSETYLCIGETAAGVQSTGPKDFKSQVYDASNQKFVFSNDSGEWLVKRLGSNHPLFTQCEYKGFCSEKEVWAGVFLRLSDGSFHYIQEQPVSQDLKTTVTLVVKGLCSRL